MKIDPKVRRKLERMLRHPIPEPNTEAYGPFLESLRHNQPALARELESAVILESFGDPKSQAERRAILAERLLAVRRGFFMRYDETVGEWFPSRKKMLLWLLAPIALVLGTVYVRSLPNNGSVQAQVSEVVENVGAQLGFGSSFNTGVDMTPPPDLAPAEEAAPAPKTQQVSVASASPSPLKQTASQGQSASQGQVTPPPPALLPTGIYTREAAGTNAVYNRETPALATQGDPFASTQPRGERTLSVYSADGTPQSLSVLKASNAQRSLSVYNADAPNQISVYTSDINGANDVVGEAASDPFAATEPAAPATSLATTEPQALTQAAPENYLPGTSLAATLEVGIIAIADEVTPVIARGDDGSVWQGEATLGDTNRFTLEFTSVTLAGVTKDVNARAMADDGYADLPATVQETTPALASDLLRGSLRGVSNYVEGLGKQTTTTLDPFGKTVVTRTAPSLENQILGSVSDLFRPTTDQALVRVVQLAKDTRFTIMVF